MKRLVALVTATPGAALAHHEHAGLTAPTHDAFQVGAYAAFALIAAVLVVVLIRERAS